MEQESIEAILKRHKVYSIDLELELLRHLERIVERREKPAVIKNHERRKNKTQGEMYKV